ANPTSLGAPVATTVANRLAGTAVLEYGATEILPPVAAVSKYLARLCRPRRHSSRAHPREKPGFSTYESDLGRETDSPLEGTGFEPSVPLVRKALLGLPIGDVGTKGGALTGSGSGVRCEPEFLRLRGAPALGISGARGSGESRNSLCVVGSRCGMATSQWVT